MEVMGSRLGLWALLWVVGLALLVGVPEGEAAAMPDFGGRGGDMRSAIKFLQDMDSYYGQIARPRYVFCCQFILIGFADTYFITKKSFNKRWPRQKLMNYFNTRNRYSIFALRNNLFLNV